MELRSPTATREVRRRSTWAVARSRSAAIQTKSSQHMYSGFRTSVGHRFCLQVRAGCSLILERRPGRTCKRAQDFCMEEARDFEIHRRLFVRAEYRGIFYNAPTFNLNTLNGLDRFTHRAEPAIGFGYRF